MQPNQQPHLNGNGNLMKWVIGLLFPSVAGGTIAWVTHMSSTAHKHAEKLAVMESHIHYVREDLARINSKMDRLLRIEGK